LSKSIIGAFDSSKVSIWIMALKIGDIANLAIALGMVKTEEFA
jgi:hypothetical protein